MEDTQTQAARPNVPGTHRVQVTDRVNDAQKALIYGGTAVVAGSILLLAWKGLTRWLG